MKCVLESDVEYIEITHATKAETKRAGCDVARRNKSELLIHRRDGKITERNTYGHDPRRSKG